ncbi:MAG: hypothetical protein IJ049_00775 [Oscillospiraceae bacterium]|nr:hypothetical protein [Oscillospiraceae bacterium]
MFCVKVDILSMTDDAQPVFVECSLVDCNGNIHLFRDKLPVFTKEDAPKVPCEGVLRCTILQEKRDTVVIDTSLPDDIESSDGKTVFEVGRDQMSFL